MRKLFHRGTTGPPRPGLDVGKVVVLVLAIIIALLAIKNAASFLIMGAIGILIVLLVIISMTPRG